MDHESEIPGQPSGGFKLGDLHVHPDSGLVRGPKGTIHLEPRVASLITVLAKTPGELVTRKALLSALWPSDEVYDDALTQCVYQLRQQLVIAGGDNRYRDMIVTVPKRGYVLQAGVEPLVSETRNDPDAPVPGRRGDDWRVLAALLVLVVVATAWLWNQRDPDASDHRPTTIAVLPFLPLLDEQSNPALEQGMADTLITRLGGLQDIVVRPISSVRLFNAADRDPLHAGRQLDADTVVDGSIQQTADSLRVTVRLLRVADGASLWADTFEEPASHIFAMQDAIATRIAEALAARLLPNEQANTAFSGTTNTRAYELYLRGRYHLSRLTRVDLLAAIEQFNQAVAIDPEYADAWTGLGSAHFRITLGSEGPPWEHFPQARHAAEQALRINPDLAEGHSLLGWVAHWYDWDWEAAERHFIRANELNPEETEAHLGYAHLLSNIGRPEQAVTEVRRAREISPLYMAAAALEGGFLIGAGRGDEALQHLEQAVRIDPEFWFTHMVLSSAYRQAGRLDEALEQVRLAGRLNDDATWAMANEIGVLVNMGRREEAEAVLDRLLQRARERFVPPYDIAMAYLNLGDFDESLTWLQTAYEGRDPKMTFLYVSPQWRALQDRPGFEELMSAMNFPR